jgi:hypothetical protein
MEMREKTVTLQLMKETGNTYVYREEGHERHKQTFPIIYAQKHNFVGSPPVKIEVTMKWGSVS